MGADDFLIKGKVLLALKTFAVAGKSGPMPAHDCDEGKTADWAANCCQRIEFARKEINFSGKGLGVPEDVGVLVGIILVWLHHRCGFLR